MERLIFFTSWIMVLMLLVALPAHADQQFDLQFEKQDRTAWIALPDRFSLNKKYPVVIVLHGTGSSGDQMRTLTRLDVLGDKEGFISVFPDGTPSLGNTMMTWNAGACCGKAVEREVEDVKFIDVLINETIRKFRGDPARIYLVGHGNGAMMAYRYACVNPGRVAAMAVNAGQASFIKCNAAKRAVPTLHIQGTQDSCALYGGGERCGACYKAIPLLAEDIRPWSCPGAETALRRWAQENECFKPVVKTLSVGNIECYAWGGCRGNTDVNFCRIIGGGHNWPGADNTVPGCERTPHASRCEAWRKVIGSVSSEIDASHFMWNYLKKYRR